MMTDLLNNERQGAARRTLALTVATTLALALLVGGCSPKGESGSAGASSSSSSTTALRIGYFPNVTHAVALVGTGKGFFQKALGTEAHVEEQTFSAGPAEIEALFAGAIDIGYIGPGPAVNGYLKSNGSALKIIAGASSGGAALVARTGVSIKSVADLAGKRVAVPQTGGTQDISLRHALTEAKLAPKASGGTVDVVQYAPTDVETQMQMGSLDAAWLPEPWVARLEQNKIATLVLDERDRWPGGKFATTVVIVRADFLKQHGPLVAKFLEGHVQTVRWIQANPDEAQKTIGERIAALTKKPLPNAVLASALKRTQITDDPQTNSVLTFADWAKGLGYLHQDRSALTGLFDTTLLDAARKQAQSVASAASQKKETP